MKRKNRVNRDPLDLDFLEKKPDIRTTRKRVLIVFGDISGFRNWTKLPLVSPEKFTAFMVNVYKKFIAFRNGSGYFTKLMGDGLMTVVELDENPTRRRKETQSLLRQAYKLASSVERLIKTLTYPQPGGFRIRLVAGDVLRVEAVYPTDPKKRQLDYIGYPINLASSLLDVKRDVTCLCHVTVKEIVRWKNKDQNTLKFSKVSKPKDCPKGIAPEDLETLWKFQARG